MSTARRSTTGCNVCKSRRKKCDETKPACLRCLSLGKSCSYEYVKHSEGEGHRVKRTIPAPRTSSGLLVKAARKIPASLPGVNVASSSSPLISEGSNVLARSDSLETWVDTYLTPSLAISNHPDLQDTGTFFFSPQHQVQRPLTPPYLHDQPSSDSQRPATALSAGRADCLESLFSLARPDDPLDQAPWTLQDPRKIHSPPDLAPNPPWDVVGSMSQMSIYPTFPHLPLELNSTATTLTLPDLALSAAGMVCASHPTPPDSAISEHGDDEDEDDNDPEKVRLAMCMVPIMDKNTQDNTLPFVLQSYSQWAVARYFEPLKIVHALRDQVITQFSSEGSRTRTILIANVMDMFAKNLAIDPDRKSVLDHLALDLRNNGSSFMAASPPSTSAPELDKEIALRSLDSVLEIFALRACTQSIAAVMRLLEDTAPVFRRACPEPPGQPLNLPNLLQEPNHTFRHFAYMDIIASVTTGRPTYFQYDVPFSLDLCERMYLWESEGNCGLQWLNGFSAQFILLFAWINTLSQTPGAGDDPELIAWIETSLPQIKVTTDQSGDPLLRIGRMVVQSCWRFAVRIYLYLVLCRANAYDPRVVRAQKGFMRLIRGVKAARNPDAYLLNLIAIAGVATIEEQDRATLRQRIINVREYAEQGTVGNEVMLMLEDVWTRTRDEGRPAVWADLRIACFRVTGA